MELQAPYWRKQLGELAAQVGEMRTLSAKAAADVAAPIRGAGNAASKAYTRLPRFT